MWSRSGGLNDLVWCITILVAVNHRTLSKLSFSNYSLTFRQKPWAWRNIWGRRGNQRHHGRVSQTFWSHRWPSRGPSTECLWSGANRLVWGHRRARDSNLYTDSWRCDPSPTGYHICALEQMTSSLAYPSYACGMGSLSLVTTRCDERYLSCGKKYLTTYFSRAVVLFTKPCLTWLIFWINCAAIII